MKYKTLDKNDKIREGDQWFRDWLRGGEWVDCLPQEFGRPGDDCCVEHRRPIQEELEKAFPLRAYCPCTIIGELEALRKENKELKDKLKKFVDLAKGME